MYGNWGFLQERMGYIMKRMVFGESVQGASHKRVNMECQDSYKKLEYDDGTIIMAVADGHGSKSCPYSKSGSSIAVNVFCKVMDEFHASYAENLEILLTYLNREGDTKVAQAIDAEWKRRVLKVHTNQKREVPLTEDGKRNKAEIYKQYGSTLVGLMITPIFIFAFQLGDGDISFIDHNGFDHLLDDEKILGVETHSDIIKQYGTEEVAANLKGWLAETSAMGCGDDITVLISYFTDGALE